MSQLFIGIDSGTQSTRAVLVDGATGRVLAARSAAYGILPSEVPGTKEQDPADWLRAATEVVAGVLAAAGADAAGRVAGIGISGQQHGFVPLDAEGAGKVFRLIEALDDSDDVQNVWANFDVSDEIMEAVDA